MIVKKKADMGEASNKKYEKEYYFNKDEFLLRGDPDGRVYILDWKGMRFMDYKKAMWEEEYPDLSQCRRISKEEVRKEIQAFIDSTVRDGEKLIREL